MSLLDHGLVPDCLLLDLVLPDGNGEDVLMKVRDGGLKTRVAICTGSQDAARLSRLRSMNPNGILLKPVDLAELEGVWKCCS
jgi:DNA-binding NarL/FixJ family response regulator